MLKAILANKLILAIIAGVTVVGIGTGVYFGVINTNNTKTNDTVAPKLTDQDIVRNFFLLIDEGMASDAVLAMSAQNTTDDSVKQAWAVQFNKMNSVKVVSIEPSMEENWTESRHTYKTVLDVVMDPSSANEPIPYYGYENGQNTRFISIVKEYGFWMIDGIATGP